MAADSCEVRQLRVAKHKQFTKYHFCGIFIFMRINYRLDGVSWSISLQSSQEARALLAAQASPVGNEALATTDPKIDRITPGIRTIERLRFAELVLPAEIGIDSIEFPLEETQHLSGLTYGVMRRAREIGEPVTEFDEELARIEDQIASFFDELEES